MPSDSKIAPRIDENGEPVCSGEKCPQYVFYDGSHCGLDGQEATFVEFVPGRTACYPALRRQLDEARALVEKWDRCAEIGACERCMKAEAEVERLRRKLANKQSVERFAAWIAKQPWCKVQDTEYWLTKAEEYSAALTEAPDAE